MALAPELGSNPEYRVALSVSDGVNEVFQTVTIRVIDDNDPPYLVSTQFELLEDSQGFEGSLETGDQDDDLVSIVVNKGPKNGSISLENRNFTYIPDPDFFDQDTVEVLLDDGMVTTLAEFSLLVEPLNDPPVALDDTVYFYQKNRQPNPIIGFNVLKNDHSGVDEKAEEEFYEVKLAQSKTIHGVNIISNVIEGSFSYQPPPGFMGEDSFQYRLIDQGLEDIATVRIWISTSADLPEWTNLMHFGSYFREISGTRQNWIYHNDMGWVYVNQPDQIINATWMWREYLGWFWTGDLYFNWVYSDTFKKWMHWEGGISKNKDWFVRDENNNIYDEAYFIQKIREAEEKAAQEKEKPNLESKESVNLQKRIK